MDDFEKRCRALFDEGWTPHFKMIVGGKWECSLECGVDVLPPNIPRPRAITETQRDGLYAVIEQRRKLLAK
jgi:hypothetical protein